MIPVLFSIGPVQIFSFGLMVALGVLLSVLLMTKQAEKSGFPQPDQVLDLVFVTILSGFLGGRIAYVIENFEYYYQNPANILAFWEGGLIFYGGVVGSLLGLAVFTRVKSLSYIDSLDFLIPYVALSHAFGRLGCFLNGCCSGKICDLPWGVTFPGQEHAVHPTQLYEMMFNLVVFIFLVKRYDKKAFSGQIILLYFMLYAAGRFVIEFFREGNPFWGLLTANQWFGIFLFVASVFLYAFLRNGNLRRQAS